jgi:AraC-like DNA-binding protein
VKTWVRGAIVVQRSLRIEAGVPLLRQRFVGSDTRVVVTHDASLRSVVEVRAGRLWLGTARREVLAPARFVLAVPPRSLLVMRFEGAEVDADGTGAAGALDGHTVPTLEALPAGASPRAACGAAIAQIDPDLGAPPQLAAARARLHDVIGALAPVRTVAADVGLRAETLTRRFAAAFGIEPKRYCHRARLFDAAVRLFAGASIVDAALDAGFNDLKRFYVQFRRQLDATPGDYATIGAPQARRKRQDRPVADR